MSDHTVDATKMVDFLRGYNAWRRGEEDMPMPDPAEISRAIDGACDTLELLTAERDALLARIQKASAHLENPTTLAEKKARVALTEIVHGGAQ